MRFATTHTTNPLYAFSAYRFHFNGKETDNEVYGEGNVYDYGFRIYNPRLGKFLSVDPLTKNYAMLTPYQFAANTPIRAIDVDGLEAAEVGKHNPLLVIIVLGRNGGIARDDIENGNTQYENLPDNKKKDDGLSLLGQMPIDAIVITFAGSDDEQTTNDIHETIKNYRTTNPEGKIVLIGHSIGALNAMDAAIKVEKDNTIANKMIDLLIVLEPVKVENNYGYSVSRTLGSNVKSIINYSASHSRFPGGKAEGGLGNRGDFTLRSGTDHSNMDNTLLTVIGAVLKSFQKGVDPVKAASKIDYQNLKTHDNGSRIPKAKGGTSL